MTRLPRVSSIKFKYHYPITNYQQIQCMHMDQMETQFLTYSSLHGVIDKSQLILLPDWTDEDIIHHFEPFIIEKNKLKNVEFNDLLINYETQSTFLNLMHINDQS
eukprot:170444_1